MSELLNLVGHSAGAALYAVLLAMIVRAGEPSGGNRVGLDRLLLLAALLGLLWNLCALTTYELPRVGLTGPFPLLSATGFVALGLLPASIGLNRLFG